MTSTITKSDSLQREAETAPQLFDDWFDPIEAAVRDRARQFIEETSSTRYWPARVMGETRQPAKKKEPAWPDTATAAGGGR